MARKYKEEKSSGRTILLVDDNAEYLAATQMVLEHEGHKILSALSGPEAIEILKNNPAIDLVLLDYFMPEMTGEQVVTEIRKTNSTIQIILQTGYASENPPRELMRRLSIQGYYDKSEGTDKLLLWVDVGLRAAYTVNLLNKSRQGLSYILDVTPEMHKIQPLDDLLQGILWQFSGLLGFRNSFLAIMPPKENNSETVQKSNYESFLAIMKEDSTLRIHAGIGKFNGKLLIEESLDKSDLDTVFRTLGSGSICYQNSSTFIPLRVGTTSLGIIYIDNVIINETDIDLLNIFANQAAVAIHNAQLYDLATRDNLTGTNIRRYAIQLLVREIRSSFHQKSFLSLLTFDLDNLKLINDSGSTSAGDRALSLLGKALKKATRINDFIGRLGGDEFLVALPETDQDGAANVAERINKILLLEKIYGPGIVHTLSGCMGIVTLKPVELNIEQFPHPLPHRYFQAMAHIILKNAEISMNLAKKAGNGSLKIADQMNWLRFEDAIEQFDKSDTANIDDLM